MPNQHDPDILRGIGRGPWACQWADEQAEHGASFFGVDIYEAAPENPEWVNTWSGKLADAIVDLNGCSLFELFTRAVNDGFPKHAETFGYYLGMQADGHGVAWDDDHCAKLTILLPYTEMYEGANIDRRFDHPHPRKR